MLDKKLLPSPIKIILISLCYLAMSAVFRYLARRNSLQQPWEMTAASKGRRSVVGSMDLELRDGSGRTYGLQVNHRQMVAERKGCRLGRVVEAEHRAIRETDIPGQRTSGLHRTRSLEK